MTRGFNYLSGCVTAFCFSAVKECPGSMGVRSSRLAIHSPAQGRLEMHNVPPIFLIIDSYSVAHYPQAHVIRVIHSGCADGLINPHGRDVEGRAPTYLDHHSGIQGWCFISVLSPRLPHRTMSGRTMPGSLIIFYMIVSTVQYHI